MPVKFPEQFSDPRLSALDARRQLALSLLKGAGDTSPVYSPWGALNRALSPLAGALALRKVNEQYGDISNAAAPEYAKLAASADPAAMAAASQNPLVRALLPQLAQMQIESGFDTRNAASKESAVGNARLGYEPQLNAANTDARLAAELKFAPQQTQVEVAREQALLPLKEKLLSLQQAPSYADLAEQKRHNMAIEAASNPFGTMTAPAPAQAPTAAPMVTSKAQFDALPSGAVYREADGQTYRKP